MFAAVVDVLAGQQPLTTSMPSRTPVEPFAGTGPAPPERLLVEPLAGSDAEEEAAIEHHRRRGGRLGDVDRMPRWISAVTPVPSSIASVALAIAPIVVHT